MRSFDSADSGSLEVARSTGKVFVCSDHGCGKSFARREHLRRHELNHKDGNHTCPRCAAHFRRRDLLDRHVQRHRQKDAEAGGEGLGYLATRKRLWKDSDGNVVNSSRPYRNTLRNASFDDGTERQSERVDDVNNLAPLSPPTSLPSSGAGPSSNEQRSDAAYLQDPWPPMDMDFIPQTEGTDLDFLSNSTWGNQAFHTLLGGPGALPDHESSYPDTTISFNAPLTTVNYYSWLFGDGLATADNALQHPRSLLDTGSGPGATDYSSGNDPNDQLPGYLPTESSGSQLSSRSTLSPRSSETSLSLHQASNSHTQSRHEEVSFLSPIQSPGQGLGNLLAPTQSPASASPSEQGRSGDLGVIAIDSPSLYFSAHRQTHSVANPAAHSASSHSTPLPDSYVRKTPLKLPTITNEARDGLMQLISQARPRRPDGAEISSCDQLLSLSSLQHYSDLFFTRFNTTYPLLHQATFQSSKVHPLQLMAVVLLGATYSDKEAHMFAVCIHDIMRPLIHASPEFSTKPKLWVMQTILLVECFGKTRAGEKQHDMAHVYHGLQINLLRRSDCLNPYMSPWDKSTQTLEEYWHTALEVEQKRRLAMISFMWDTQHAILFAQILCMNASELKVTLPWDTAIWEAETAEEWLHLTQTSPPSPHYLGVMQRYTDPNAAFPPPHLNVLSRVLVLYGLMSLSWDFRRRDQTALNRAAPAVPGSAWQTRISACYEKWKIDFDSYTNSVLSSLSTYPAQQAKFQRFAVSHSAIYHTAQLILEIEPADLQITAGAKHIIGRPVTKLDRQRSRARIVDFLRREDGKSAGRGAWHAARLFRDGVRKLDNWNVDEMVHYPWCLYLATLMCWAMYRAAAEGRPGELQDSVGAPLSDGDEDADWDSRTDMKALISALTRLDRANDRFAKDIWLVAGNYTPYGLITCMVKHLSTVRWAVIREGMIVLKNLGGWSQSSVAC